MNPPLNQTTPTESGPVNSGSNGEFAACMEAGLLLYAAQVQAAYAKLLKLLWPE